MNFSCSLTPSLSQVAERFEQISTLPESNVRGIKEEVEPSSSFQSGMHRIWRILGHILPDEVQDLTQDMEAMRISNFAKKMEHLIQILTKLEAKVKSNINIQCDIDAELSEALQILQNILKEKQASNDVSLTEMFSVQFALNKMTELQDMAKLSSKLADFFKLDTHIR